MRGRKQWYSDLGPNPGVAALSIKHKTSTVRESDLAATCKILWGADTETEKKTGPDVEV